MEIINSTQNSRIKEWCKLHQKKGRDEAGRFLIEGEHLIQEALKEGIVEVILFDAECPFSFEHTIQVTPEIMKKLSQNVSQVHLIAVCRFLEKDMGIRTRVVLLDNVQDPGNMGTIIRTAVSFGFDAIICSNECVDVYNDKTIRSTQGALFHIPVIKAPLVDVIRELKKENFFVLGTSLQESKGLQEIEIGDKMAFVFGNEGQGVSESVLKACDQNIKIEMHTFESLNVAIAAGIVLYQFRK